MTRAEALRRSKAGDPGEVQQTVSGIREACPNIKKYSAQNLNRYHSATSTFRHEKGRSAGTNIFSDTVLPVTLSFNEHYCNYYNAQNAKVDEINLFQNCILPMVIQYEQRPDHNRGIRDPVRRYCFQ